MTIKLSRAALYELVWSYPMTEIARHYGVRDLQIAQACDFYDIARPRAGYWQKLAYGKNVEKIDLQTVSFSADDTVTIERAGGHSRRTNREISATTGFSTYGTL